MPRKTSVQVAKAADQLGISISKFIEQAVETDLGKLDIRKETHAARKQRDKFKEKMEAAQADLAVAEVKIEALEARGLVARILNLNPDI